MDLIDNIKPRCNPVNSKKICNYLIFSSNFAAGSVEQRKILEIVYEIYINTLLIVYLHKINSSELPY